MKSSKLTHVVRTGLALLGIYSFTAHADINANMITHPAHQIGTSGIISYGVTVVAQTNMNALWASASYSIECSDPKIRPPLQGARGWSDNGIKGPRSIVVTAPAWLPATESLPGWQAVTPGSYVSCVLVARGAAKTHILPIGGGGTSFPIGGDAWDETRSQEFGVLKTGSIFDDVCLL